MGKIPKKIHYCWFGGNPLPELAQKCIESWKKYCPDYEIIQWDESNFDLNCCDYVKEAYAAKKWAFVSDVARLYALVNYGGVYMDTDVEVVKPLDVFLDCDAFSGFENETSIPTGIMACRAHHPLFEELLRDYDNAHFLREDGTPDTTTNVIRITDICLKYGLVRNNTLQTVGGFTLYPKDYFCPKDSKTAKVMLTENSYTIHHFDGSWLPEEERNYEKLRARMGRFLPSTVANYLARAAMAVKHRGLSGLVETAKNFLKKRTK